MASRARAICIFSNLMNDVKQLIVFVCIHLITIIDLNDDPYTRIHPVPSAIPQGFIQRAVKCKYFQKGLRYHIHGSIR